MRRLLLAAILTCSAAAAVEVPVSDTHALLEQLLARHKFPGMALVVVKDGMICDRAAAGLRKAGADEPLRIGDQFHIGSCTKSMTATLAAMLIEDGKLRWDTKIAAIFPEWETEIHPAYRKVTLVQLLTHRGGAPGDVPGTIWQRAREQHGTPREQRLEFILEILKNPPPVEPGTQFLYSNQGYAIAGAMLEKVAGKDWERLMSERLFQPLGMKSAGFGPPGRPHLVEQPWGHTRHGGEWEPVFDDNPPAIAPAGTVHCSLEDLARYVMFHLGNPPQDKLLSTDSLHHLHKAPPGAGYALGWAVTRRDWAHGLTLTHTGSNLLWYVVMWVAPNRNFAVVVGANAAGDEVSRACDEAAAAMSKKWLQNQ